METAHRNNLAEVALEAAPEIPVGVTVLNIVVALHIAIGRLPIDLAARREATPLLIVRRVPGNSLAVKVATCRAIGPVRASATGPEAD